MSGKQFDQQQKVAIVENASEIGIKEASRIAGVHYTAVYEWSREIKLKGCVKNASRAKKSVLIGV